MVKHGIAIALLAAGSLAVRAQDPTRGPDSEQRLRRLEQQNQEILDRLRTTEARNAELESEVTTLRASHAELAAEHDGSVLETQVNAITERFDGVTYKDLTRSGNPIKFYGFFRHDTYFDTARFNSIILPAWVIAENDAAAEANDEEFAMDVRLTRFGFDVNAGHIGSADVMGKLETDFANFPTGSSESRETPRIRLAYINMKFDEFTIRLGQDWDVISPIFPTVNGEFLMWNAGNLGDRRPQAQFIWNTGSNTGTEFELRGSLGFTGAVDSLDLDAGLTAMSVPTRAFSSTQLDGWDFGLPNGQLRAGVTFPSWVENKRAIVGVWGYIAGLETDAKFNGEDEFTAWAIGTDITLPLFGPLGLRGELWAGSALSDVRGGIGQAITTATGEEIDSIGGWAELVWQVTDEFRLTGGGTMDNVDDDDIGAGARSKNWTLYVNALYTWGGGLKTGLDVIWWETQWDDTGVGNAVRFDLYTQLDF